MNSARVVWPVLTAGESTLSAIADTANRAATLLRYLTREYEQHSHYPLPLSDRLEAWRHGFMARDWILLNLETNDPDDYLSATQQATHIAPAVNPDYADVLDNKLAFHHATPTEHLPTLYGHLDDTFHPHDADADDIPTLLDTHDDLILKPTTGSQGRNVTHATTTDDGYALNGDPHTRTELQTHLENRADTIVTEHLTNHAYATAIAPTALNTIRILTIPDPDTNDFFVASAIHRFGTTDTGPTDNWSGGGYAAPIDPTTGTLGYLHTYTPTDGLQHLTHHPDTDTRVHDRTIPHWDTITDTATNLADHHRDNPYIGWDIALTPDGPTVLEGNTAPHLALQQLGGGLLTDDRVEQFLTTHT